MAQRSDGSRPRRPPCLPPPPDRRLPLLAAATGSAQRKPLGGIDRETAKGRVDGMLIKGGRLLFSGMPETTSSPAGLLLPTVSVAGGGAGVEGSPVRRPEGPVVARWVQVQLQHAELR